MSELILVILALIALVIISIGIAISKSSDLSDMQTLYNQEKAKASSALSDNKKLEKQVAELKKELIDLIGDHTDLIGDHTDLIGENAKLKKWEDEEYLMSVFESKHKDAYKEYSDLLAQSQKLEEILHPYNCGVYEPEFDFDDSETYKNNRLRAHEDAKAMVKEKKAIIVKNDYPYFIKMAEIALHCFNSECDKCISEVKWNNVFKYEQKINKVFETINKNLESIGIKIQPEYLNLRIKELHLAYEYKLKKQREKEEQDNIRALMREQEKAEREIQSALIKADAEEKKYLARFEKVKSTLDTLQGDRLLKAEEQIRELEARLAEVRASKERALSMAEQTKRGYVYVISNLGSFGDNIYKIGLTRRLDPMERVRELGDASVPFPFDVHAMIFSEDAPKLEATLHQRFADKRVNMINNRKEFFNVSLKEIADVVAEYNATIEFTLLAEASDYRQTLAIKENTSGQKE